MRSTINKIIAQMDDVADEDECEFLKWITVRDMMEIQNARPNIATYLTHKIWEFQYSEDNQDIEEKMPSKVLKKVPSTSSALGSFPMNLRNLHQRIFKRKPSKK